MVLCREESAFATYYPPEAHSFCNRRLEEELNSDFVIAGPGACLKHTASTPALHGSPRHQRANISSVDDNWRQTAPVARGGPTSAKEAKKLKKKKAQKKKENEKAPFSVLGQLEESGDEEMPGDDGDAEREHTPST